MPETQFREAKIAAKKAWEESGLILCYFCAGPTDDTYWANDLDGLCEFADRLVTKRELVTRYLNNPHTEIVCSEACMEKHTLDVPLGTFIADEKGREGELVEGKPPTIN
jgi:hypothetical protein